MCKYLQVGFWIVSPWLLSGCFLVDRAYEPRPRAVIARPRAATPMPVPTQRTGPAAPLLRQALEISNPPRPNPNGYDLLVRAAQSIQPKLAPEGDIDAQRAAAKKNAPALALVRQAFKLPIMSPPTRGVPVANPSRSQLRMLARSLIQDAWVHGVDGEVNAAVQRDLDAVQMGVAMQNGGGNLTMLTGVAIEDLGRKDLARWSRQLSAAQASQAAQRLQTIEALRPDYVTIVTEEKWENLSFLREILKNNLQQKKPRDWSAMFKDPADQAILLATSNQQIEANLVAAMNASIARARQPYSSKLPEILQPADPLSAMLVNSETSRRRFNSRLTYERNLANSRLTLTELALQAMVKEQEKIPQKLDELVPKYLPTVPGDPFAPGSPLRLKADDSNFTVYSVGPDGADDGGVLIQGRGVTLDSRGDLLTSAAQEVSNWAVGFRTISPTSQHLGQSWKYTFSAPPATWTQKEFDDTKWQTGRGGFGSLGTPKTGQIGTVWNKPDIWMRRTFNPGDLTAEQIANIGIIYSHDENFEVYINGTSVYSESGFTPGYLRRPLNFAARKAILPNVENILTVHCHQTGGGQYIDVGLDQIVSIP